MVHSEDFGRAFEDNLWGSDESLSGPGSSLEYTQQLRIAFPAVLRALGCKSLVDAPCGDLNWIKDADLDGVDYIGADVVPALIRSLRDKHPHRKLITLDITQDRIPKADFWLCRDVLFHLSNYDIFGVILNFIHSEIKYLGTTHHAQCSVTADYPSAPDTWRRVNLTKKPFYLPDPMYTLWDSIDGYPSRWLAIWSRDQIQKWFWRMQGIGIRAASFHPRETSEHVVLAGWSAPPTVEVPLQGLVGGPAPEGEAEPAETGSPSSPEASAPGGARRT